MVCDLSNRLPPSCPFMAPINHQPSLVQVLYLPPASKLDLDLDLIPRRLLEPALVSSVLLEISPAICASQCWLPSRWPSWPSPVQC